MFKPFFFLYLLKCTFRNKLGHSIVIGKRVFDIQKKKNIDIAHYMTSNNHVLPLSHKTEHKTCLPLQSAYRNPLSLIKINTLTNSTYFVMGRSFSEAD